MPERLLGLLAGLSVMLILLTGCQAPGAELPDSFDEELVEEEATRSIAFFNEQDYQSIIDMGSRELKETYTAEELAEQWEPIREKRGGFQEIVKTVFFGNGKDGEEYGGIVLVGNYEKGKLQFNIAFNEEMELVGFWVK